MSSAPEYENIEAFAQYLMDDERDAFSVEDVAVLNMTTRTPVQKIVRELESYGFKKLERVAPKRVRGITDSPHGTSPFVGMHGGAAFQSVVDAKFGRNPFEPRGFPKPDTGFRKAFSAD